MLIDYAKIFKIKKNESIENSELAHIDPTLICENIKSLEVNAKITPGLIKPLNLLWSDEFDNDYINQDKWIIKTTSDCVLDQKISHRIRENKYFNFSQTHVEVSNCSLKLNPIGGQYCQLNKDKNSNYSGIVLSTIPCFGNVRVEISAKIPSGSDMIADLYMQGYKGNCNSDKINGMLRMENFEENRLEEKWFKFNQTRRNRYDKVYYDSSIGLDKNGNERIKTIFSEILLSSNFWLTKKFYTRLNSNNFQKYAIEWNSNAIQFIFNDRVIYQQNNDLEQIGPSRSLKERKAYPTYYLPFTHPFNLLFKILIRNDTNLTKPPIIEIDYIRVYGNDLVGSQIIDGQIDGINRFIKPENNSKTNEINVYRATSTYLLYGISVLVIVLVISVILLFLRNRKINKQANLNEIYYDNFTKENYYNEYNYSEAYLDIIPEDVDYSGNNIYSEAIFEEDETPKEYLALTQTK